MSVFDEEKPVRKTSHDIGADLSAISVDELRARVSLLKDEIARIEREIAAKSSSRSAAEQLFRS